jgi:hypothetical protein
MEQGVTVQLVHVSGSIDLCVMVSFGQQVAKDETQPACMSLIALIPLDFERVHSINLQIVKLRC